MKISMIAAMANDNVIGKNNDLPWKGKLPADMSFFIKHTKEKPVIMGRKTFDSIGKPLPNRLNIIVSSNKSLKIEGAIVVNSISDALITAQGHDEVMVIGGTNIYEQCLKVADRLYITEIELNVQGGDAKFPEIDESWSLVESVLNEKDEVNLYNYSFNIYER